MQCTRKEAAILQQIYIHNILTIFTEWCIIIDINAESMNIYSSREQKMEKAFLILATGETIEGNHIGASGCSIGELVFTTQLRGADSHTNLSPHRELRSKCGGLRGRAGTFRICRFGVL